MIRETRKQMELEKDQKKQEQIDLLVQELIETMGSPRAASSDEWTSLPLSVWVMDPDVSGYSLREGEDRLLVSDMQDHLSENPRIQLVERAVLDKLLRELKLGSSELADRQTALALGKILSARILLAGNITYACPEKQIALRMIETETGRITATVSELFPCAAAVSMLSEKLSAILIEKMEKTYPIRGMIDRISGDMITLNIGQTVGVRTGQKFSVVETGDVMEITSVTSHSAHAKTSAGNPPEIGMKVEVMTDN